MLYIYKCTAQYKILIMSTFLAFKKLLFFDDSLFCLSSIFAPFYDIIILNLSAGGSNMGKPIKVFNNGSFLEYDRGSFDDWCVYFSKGDGKRKPPRDMDYFSQLKDLAKKYSSERIYNDYVRVYDLTGKEVEESALLKITEIASSYGNDALDIDIIFSILYMAMIAEERKQYTRLGKRIKRLGIYKLLIEKSNIYEAANFMRGMNRKDIDELCKNRGF